MAMTSAITSNGSAATTSPEDWAEAMPAAEVATAMERLARNDVRYRFVLDLADLS